DTFLTFSFTNSQSGLAQPGFSHSAKNGQISLGTRSERRRVSFVSLFFWLLKFKFKIKSKTRY
ncbi:hypothetical protein J0676_27340, partial [Vibrio sp. Vb2880]|uniref:hypothetical protein n=1 Tax=Vibrio sp. Vb2880 TaxID=2816076 RepID=UPI001A8E3446